MNIGLQSTRSRRLMAGVRLTRRETLAREEEASESRACGFRWLHYCASDV